MARVLTQTLVLSFTCQPLLFFGRFYIPGQLLNNEIPVRIL